MRRIIQMIGCILVSVALLIAQMAFAESAVPAPTDDFWFLDEANVLSDATEGEIFFSNQRMADVSASEIVVVAVNSTGNYTIDDYANNLYNQWEINVEGVLMLLAIQDDDYYVLPGAVLGQSLHSSEIQELLNTYLEPDFAAKNYDSGVKKAFEALYARVAELNHLSVKVQDGINDYEAFIAGEIAEVGGTTGSNAVAGSTQSVDWVPEQNIRQEREGGSFLPLLIVILLVVILVAVSRSNRRRNTRYYDAGVDVPPPTRSSGFGTGFLMGSLFGSRRSRPPMGGWGGPSAPPPGPAPRQSGVPYQGPAAPRSGYSSGAGRTTSSAPRSSFGSSASRPSSGVSRGSFSSGTSRSSFGSSVGRSSGFGGASRNHSSMGSGSRGGGAGRFGKR